MRCIAILTVSVLVLCLMADAVVARPGGGGQAGNRGSQDGARGGGDQRPRGIKCRYDRSVEWDRRACDVIGADLSVAMATRTIPLMRGEGCSATRTETVKCSNVDKKINKQQRIAQRILDRKNGCKYGFWASEWDKSLCEEAGADLSVVKATVTMPLLSGSGECAVVKVRSVPCNKFDNWVFWRKQLLNLKDQMKKLRQQRKAERAQRAQKTAAQ